MHDMYVYGQEELGHSYAIVRSRHVLCSPVGVAKKGGDCVGLYGVFANLCTRLEVHKGGFLDEVD